MISADLPGNAPTVPRRFGLLEATALNMSNMIGIGPFITIPLLLSAMGGPQAMLGWLVAILIALPDGMVWSELASAMPASGGSYIYLREAFGRLTFGRLMAFLFIWQFLLSGPLEIASGYIGFVQYLHYLWPNLTRVGEGVVIVALGLLNVVLLYRRIDSVALLTVTLWVGTMLTVGAVALAGAFHFDPRLAFDFPPHAFQFSVGMMFGLGAASRIGVYDYLGYYDICFLADEVKNPARTMPRSIILSLVAVAAIYLAVNLSIIGVVPWREFVPADAHPASNFIVSVFMERLFGPRIASLFTGLILWTAFASVFALLLGYSRIPYAAAKDGYFFRAFSRLHPTGKFPHLSLLLLGLISIACSFFSLQKVIDALISTRILVQFIAQVVAVWLLRRANPARPAPFRMWLYPLPALLALAGWLFIYLTTDRIIILFGLGFLAAGFALFLVWSRHEKTWPFAARPAGSPPG